MKEQKNEENENSEIEEIEENDGNVYNDDGFEIVGENYENENEDFGHQKK